VHLAERWREESQGRCAEEVASLAAGRVMPAGQGAAGCKPHACTSLSTNSNISPAPAHSPCPVPPPHTGRVPGGAALAAFCCCAAATHLFSALTHVWPDSHSLVGVGVGVGCRGVGWMLESDHSSPHNHKQPAKAAPSVYPLDYLFTLLQEKLDHVGIVATIVGTPITALMVGWGRLLGVVRSRVGRGGPMGRVSQGGVGHGGTDCVCQRVRGSWLRWWVGGRPGLWGRLAGDSCRKACGQQRTVPRTPASCSHSHSPACPHCLTWIPCWLPSCPLSVWCRLRSTAMCPPPWST